MSKEEGDLLTSLTHSQTHTHTWRCSKTHIYTCSHTHLLTHSLTHTHTHTPTHTQTLFPCVKEFADICTYIEILKHPQLRQLTTQCTGHPKLPSFVLLFQISLNCLICKSTRESVRGIDDESRCYKEEGKGERGGS